MKKKVFIIIHEHFDIMWRRCFDRDFQYKGKNYIPYADLEAYYIIDNIDLCDKYPDYKFFIESVAVLRKFIEKHPEYEPKIKELFNEKRIFMSMSGDNIIDSNMVQGESLVRNYLYGLEYLNDNFDFHPYAFDRDDAFGNCGQIPQIARGFGSKWVFHLVYNTCDNEYWRGIDGSTVFVYEPQIVGGTGGYYKYAPCPECQGHRNIDCPVCNNRRIDIEGMNKIRSNIRVNDEKINSLEIPGYIYVGGEEILPVDNIAKWAEENKDKYDIEFVGYDSFYPYLKDKIERVDQVSDSELHSSPEVNPNNTGTYVTRIKTKQRVRENENLISTAEFLGILSGMKDGYRNTELMHKFWQKLHFCMFHDAITATHIDAAYNELMDVHDEIYNGLNFTIKHTKQKLCVKNNETITVLNPIGAKAVNVIATAILEKNGSCDLIDENGEFVSVLSKQEKGASVEITFLAGTIEAFGIKEFKLAKRTEDVINQVIYSETEDAEVDGLLTNKVISNQTEIKNEDVVIENEFYKIIAQDNGITEIYDKELGKTISKKSQYLVGEFIVEHDEGSAWSTLSPDRRRQPLSNQTKLVCSNICNDYQELVYEICTPDVFAYSVNGLRIKYKVRLQRNIKNIFFKTNVFWDTQNYRLRVAFPTTVTGKHIYEIPYGYIERKPYEPFITYADNASNWASAAGDWPAINWAGIQADDLSVALLNKGTPSYLIDKDELGSETMYLSILRSPSVGTYLHDVKTYSMVDYDGMRDEGNHTFEYALCSYADGFDKNNVVIDAESYNREAVTFNGQIAEYSLPQITSNDVRISSTKWAEKANMLIYRLVEYHGVDSSLTINIPTDLQIKAVYEMDMKEDIKSTININDNKASVKIGKFEIKTIAFELDI